MNKIMQFLLFSLITQKPSSEASSKSFDLYEEVSHFKKV